MFNKVWKKKVWFVCASARTRACAWNSCIEYSHSTQKQKYEKKNTVVVTTITNTILPLLLIHQTKSFIFLIIFWLLLFSLFHHLHTHFFSLSFIYSSFLYIILSIFDYILFIAPFKASLHTTIVTSSPPCSYIISPAANDVVPHLLVNTPPCLILFLFYAFYFILFTMIYLCITFTMTIITL